MEKEKIKETLKKYFPFEKLTDAQLDDVINSGSLKTFKEGEIIFKEGDEGNYFCIILDGSVRISTMIPEIGEEALSIIYKGDFFGEMALIDIAPRSATAIAHTDTTLLVVPKKKFDELVSKNNPAAYWFLWGLAKKLSQRLRETDERLKAILALIRKF